MVGKYKVVTLCGSIKFKADFIKVQKDLTLKGYIVISVEFFEDNGETEVISESVQTMLGDMHKQKIDLSDAIFVINKGGYIGESTRSEIEYAEKSGKSVYYYESV